MDDFRELSGIDRALAKALDVDVSPDFAARVRQRIAREPARTPFWHGWRIAVPLAAGVVIVAAGVTMLMPRSSPEPQTLTARSFAAGPRLLVAVPASRPAVSAERTHVQKPASVVPVVAMAATEPEVLVPREEIEMYRRLIAAAHRAPAIVLDIQQGIVADAAIKEIVIVPIEIEPIMPPVGGEGERQ